jgi:hypothetical protein
MAWTPSGFDVKQTFPALRYPDAYAAICDFLNDEKQVLNALAKLQQVAVKEKVKSDTAFNDLLGRLEQSLGFSAEVIRAENFLAPHDFLTRVQHGQPLIDVGAGSQHGFVTHRVQFALMSVQFGDTIKGTPILTLYKNFANVNAWNMHDTSQESPAQKFFVDDAFVQKTSSKFSLLWDPLLDLVFSGGQNPLAQNACCPEYLHDVVGEKFSQLRPFWT